MRLIALLVLFCMAASQVVSQESSVDIDTPFTRLKLTGNIHLELVPANAQKLIFTSVANQDALNIESDKDRLELKTKSELSESTSINVKLHYKILSEIEITKGGRIQSGEILQSSILQLDILSGGKIELTIEVDSLSARINQGADIILYGNTRSQFINAYTWGNFLGYDLNAEDVYVKAATGAQVKVNAQSLLDAHATSKAFVGYTGDPELKRIKTSVGGEITPWSE